MRGLSIATVGHFTGGGCRRRQSKEGRRILRYDGEAFRFKFSTTLEPLKCTIHQFPNITCLLSTPCASSQSYIPPTPSLPHQCCQPSPPPCARGPPAAGPSAAGAASSARTRLPPICPPRAWPRPSGRLVPLGNGLSPAHAGGGEDGDSQRHARPPGLALRVPVHDVRSGASLSGLHFKNAENRIRTATKHPVYCTTLYQPARRRATRGERCRREAWWWLRAEAGGRGCGLQTARGRGARRFARGAWVIKCG